MPSVELKFLSTFLIITSPGRLADEMVTSLGRLADEMVQFKRFLWNSETVEYNRY